MHVAPLRFPLAAGFGLLLTGSLFSVLFTMTRVTFDLQQVEAITIDFTRHTRETELQTKTYDPPIERPLPLMEPRIGLPSMDEPGPPVIQLLNQPVEPLLPRGGVSVAPNRDMIPLVRIPPEYPTRAAQAGTEGWVVVQFDISETGTVLNPVVVDNEPSSIFDNAALRAIERWRYNPRVENNVPVQVKGVQVRLTFDLEE